MGATCGRGAYYASAHAAIIFYNYKSKLSYWNVIRWQHELKRYRADMPIVVCGVGADLPDSTSPAFASSPTLSVSNKSGEGAMAPILRALQDVSGDEDLRLLLDATVSPAPQVWPEIMAHICSTFSS